MKYSAHNIEQVLDQPYLAKINHKICEEIFERAFRYNVLSN
jgi:hypothetical protein